MRTRDLFFYGMIVLVVVLSIYVFYYIKTESFKCMTSPLVYGVQHLTTSDEKEIICICSPIGESFGYIVSKDNITAFDNSIRTSVNNMPVLNITGLVK